MLPQKLLLVILEFADHAGLLTSRIPSSIWRLTTVTSGRGRRKSSGAGGTKFLIAAEAYRTSGAGGSVGLPKKSRDSFNISRQITPRWDIPTNPHKTSNASQTTTHFGHQGTERLDGPDRAAVLVDSRRRPYVNDPLQLAPLSPWRES